MAAEPSNKTKAGTIVLVGCGQMGSAMLRGWLARGAAERFVVIEPAGRPMTLADVPGVGWHRRADELPNALAPDAVVLAVKPQVMDDVLPAYRRWARPQTLLVSIVAGKTIGGIARHLGPEAAIVRCMPNTPAAISRAITVACPNPRVAAKQRALCEALLAAIGESAWVEDEALMDAVTAVSGSGPAYVFYFIEAMQQAALEMGLTAEQGTQLAIATFTGAAQLAAQSPDPVAVLRERVTSKGGTTYAALTSMEASGVKAAIVKALHAAAARGKELGEQLGAAD